MYGGWLAPKHLFFGADVLLPWDEVRFAHPGQPTHAWRRRMDKTVQVVRFGAAPFWTVDGAALLDDKDLSASTVRAHAEDLPGSDATSVQDLPCCLAPLAYPNRSPARCLRCGSGPLYALSLIVTPPPSEFSHG